MENNWLGIKELRKAVGITAKEMGEKINKDATYISKIERGAIANTSYGVIMGMAQVIANSEAIKSGKVDLTDYNTEFSKLVLSCRYDYIKDVYNYVKKNKEVEEYSKIVRNLTESDIDTFSALVNYRRLNKEYCNLKEKIQNEILNQTGEKEIKKYFKNLSMEKIEIYIKGKIDLKDLMEYSFDEAVESMILGSIKSKIRDIKESGIETCETVNYEFARANEESDDECEIASVIEEN